MWREVGAILVLLAGTPYVRFRLRRCQRARDVLVPLLAAQRERVTNQATLQAVLAGLFAHHPRQAAIVLDPEYGLDIQLVGEGPDSSILISPRFDPVGPNASVFDDVIPVVQTIDRHGTVIVRPRSSRDQRARVTRP